MPYLGNVPAERYTSMTKQAITGNGGTSYTLDHAVANEQEIEVFVNNVRQEPSVAYTVSGTSLTMTGNVAASDDFYVVFQGKAIQTTSHPEGHDLKARDGTFSGNLDVTGNVETDSYIISGTTSTSFSPVQITSSTSGIGELRFADTTANAGYVKYAHSNDHMILATNATERLRVTANGLTFNGDTAAANALNDYEEGTFNASVRDKDGDNPTSVWGQAGIYTKIGNLVCIHISLSINSAGDFNEYYEIYNLPFTSSSYGDNFSIYPATFWTNTSAHIDLKGRVLRGSSVIRVSEVADNSVTSGQQVQVSAMYRTDS